MTRAAPKFVSVLSTLRDRFGFGDFRDGQEAVVNALMEGRPALAVFPTGGGKSLCYQLPALLLDGLTLVVSPLIALMKDQVDALESKGIAAARLDSTLDAEELSSLYTRLEAGGLKLLYVAPERFSNEAFRQRLKSLAIALVAIDEAHCISEWGHNFRPDYLKLAKILRRLKIRRVLALTATATPKVAREIRKQFRIAAEDHVQLSFHRPNLDLRVTPCAAAERKGVLLDRLAALEGPAVVYVTRQETAEEVATFLGKNGISAQAYHAGLHADFRTAAQKAFMEDRVRVIVATIAFGMGIDKSNIRAVIHYNLPKSLENHVQEIGRAGRDGQPAVCELLACPDDLTVLENFIYADTPAPRALGNLLDRLLRQGKRFDISPYDLGLACDIRPAVISTVIAYLEVEGILESTGTFYANYRAKLLRPVDRLLAGRPPAERTRIRKLLEAGEERRGAMHLAPDVIAALSGMARERIVADLNELEAAGDIALSLSGLRQGYVMKKALGDIGDPTELMTARFQAREQADLARLKQVLGLSACRGCLTAYLTRHFGETLAEPCGHCDRCRGIPPKTLRRPRPRRIDDDELEAVRSVVAEGYAALGSPRQLARFLCGMTSPASTRAKLNRHDAFGLLADLPFFEVMVVADSVC